MEKMTSNKLNPTALLSGVVVAIAFLFLSMSFAAALGMWSFQLNDLAFAGWPFWIAAAVAWSASTFFGSLTAVLGSRSQDRTSILLHSLIVWSGAYLIFGGLTVNISDLAVALAMSVSVKSLMWLGFMGDILSLMASVAGGWWVTRPVLPVVKRERAAVENQNEMVPTAFVPLGQFP